jgi:hypothetical protein
MPSMASILSEELHHHRHLFLSFSGTQKSGFDIFFLYKNSTAGRLSQPQTQLAHEIYQAAAWENRANQVKFNLSPCRQLNPETTRF